MLRSLQPPLLKMDVLENDNRAIYCMNKIKVCQTVQPLLYPSMSKAGELLLGKIIIIGTIEYVLHTLAESFVGVSRDS